jgi:hypothetical protein
MACAMCHFASVDKPLGMVVNEVMNPGKPIIVSDEVGCQRDLAEDG